MFDPLAHRLRQMELKFGLDRQGRTVWVWLLPPGAGLISAILSAFLPGLTADTSLLWRLSFAAVAFLIMTLASALYLISFDNDHNQQAEITPDEPSGGSQIAPRVAPPTGEPPALALPEVEIELPGRPLWPQPAALPPSKKALPAGR